MKPTRTRDDARQIGAERGQRSRRESTGDFHHSLLGTTRPRRPLLDTRSSGLAKMMSKYARGTFTTGP